MMSYQTRGTISHRDTLACTNGARDNKILQIIRPPTEKKNDIDKDTREIKTKKEKELLPQGTNKLVQTHRSTNKTRPLWVVVGEG